MSNLGEEVMENGSNREKLNRNSLEKEVMEKAEIVGRTGTGTA